VDSQAFVPKKFVILSVRITNDKAQKMRPRQNTDEAIPFTRMNRKISRLVIFNSNQSPELVYNP